VPPACEIPGVSKAILTIRHEYSRRLTVPSLTRECGMSERILHPPLFKEHFGLTPGQWKQSFQRQTGEAS
jgi:transcriptional regulator GlxA family with amidase domain